MRCAICRTILGDDHWLTDAIDKKTGEYRVMHTCKPCAFRLAWHGHGTRFDIGVHHKRSTAENEFIPLRFSAEDNAAMLV